MSNVHTQVKCELALDAVQEQLDVEKSIAGDSFTIMQSLNRIQVTLDILRQAIIERGKS